MKTHTFLASCLLVAAVATAGAGFPGSGFLAWLDATGTAVTAAICSTFAWRNRVNCLIYYMIKHI